MKLLALASFLVIASLSIPVHAASPNPPWQGLPARTTTTPASGSGDPINIAFEGTASQILTAFSKIGWKKADPLSRKHDLHLAEAFLHHGGYPTAPVSNLYLFGRPEDFAVEQQLGWVGRRHHARFWDAKRQDPSTHRELWVGDCSKDITVKIIRRHGALVGTTHKIDGHLDVERDYIVKQMQNASLVQTVIMEPGVGNVKGLKNGTGDTLYTDGKAALIILK